MNEDQFVYLQVADVVSRYGYGMSRSEVARNFRITKSTAIYHLEKCVGLGLLQKAYTWVGRNRRGWVYIAPSEYTNLLTIPDHGLPLPDSAS